MLLDRAYFERRHFEPTLTDDVLGGASVWEDVDRTEGTFFCCEGFGIGTVLVLVCVLAWVC